MDSVLNNVLNCDEHSASDHSDEFDNEMLEEANGTEVVIIGSADSRRPSHLSRDNEAAGNHANQETRLGVNNDAQLNTSSSSLLSVLKAPKASSLFRKRVQIKNPPHRKRQCRGTSTYDPKGIGPA